MTIVDSMPVSVCRFARAHRCRSLRDLSAFGHDPVAHQTYYGLHLHLRVAWPGVITAAVLAPANEADRSVAPQLLAGLAGWALGDKGYRSPALRAELATGGINQELSNKDCRSREWFINSERYMWAARIQEQERIPMRQRAIAFTLATGMALAGVTLPDVAHADRDDGNRNRVNARNDAICCAVPGSRLRISFSRLLNNDSGKNLRVLSAHLIRGFGRDVASFHVNKRGHFIVVVFRNRIRDNFVNFVYRIKGRGGRDSAIVRIRREPVSAS